MVYLQAPWKDHSESNTFVVVGIAPDRGLLQQLGRGSSDATVFWEKNPTQAISVLSCPDNNDIGGNTVTYPLDPSNKEKQE